MNSKKARVEFPDEILEGMKVENILVSPIDMDRGVAALSGMENGIYILRLYQLIRGEDQVLFPTHELEAFSFRSRHELKQFLEQLPNMSAIDILMVMNPLPAIPH